MNISILLPYKENFVSNHAGAVSLFVNDITKESVYKKIQKFLVIQSTKNIYQKIILILVLKRNYFIVQIFNMLIVLSNTKIL